MLNSTFPVFIQLGNSAANSLLYFLLIFTSSDHDDISISILYSVFMMAYVFSELGISYVAPQYLAKLNVNNRKKALGLVSVSTAIFLVISFVIVFLSEKFFLASVISASFLTNLLFPSWYVMYHPGKVWFLVFLFFRLLVVLLIFSSQDFLILLLPLVLASLFYIFMDAKPLSFRKSLFRFVLLAKKIFFSRTLSYGFYSFIPLLLGFFFSSSVTHLYLYFERIKSLTVTVVQPVFQSLFLHSLANRDFSFPVLLFIPSLFVVGLSFFVSIYSFFPKFIPNEISEIDVFACLAVTSCVAVSSSVFVYLRVLKNSDFTTFNRSVYIQIGSLLVALGSMFLLPVKYFHILLVTELVYFSSLVVLYCVGSYTSREN